MLVIQSYHIAKLGWINNIPWSCFINVHNKWQQMTTHVRSYIYIFVMVILHWNQISCVKNMILQHSFCNKAYDWVFLHMFGLQCIEYFIHIVGQRRYLQIAFKLTTEYNLVHYRESSLNYTSNATDCKYNWDNYIRDHFI